MGEKASHTKAASPESGEVELDLSRERMAALGQLTGGIGHELNNPIGVILGNLTILREYIDHLTNFVSAAQPIIDALAQGARAEQLRLNAIAAKGRAEKENLAELTADIGPITSDCIAGATRARELVSHLQRFAAPPKKRPEPVDINDAVERVLALAWNQLKYKCRVTRELGNLPKVICNVQQVCLAVLSLLLNAAEAVPKRGQITVRTRQHEERVAITITDNGEGMANDAQARIFEPGFSTKGASGMGLAAVAQIAANHQGEVTFENTPEQGSSFTLWLPLVAP